MAILTGLTRIGRDCELRFTTSGEAVANLSLAYNYGKPDQHGKKPTQWIEAALWGKRAENLAQYLVKGTPIDVVLADVHVETFQQKDGSTGTKLAARVVELEFAAPKSDSQRQEHPSGQTDNGRAKADGYAPAPKPLQKPSFDDLGDDIPF